MYIAKCNIDKIDGVKELSKKIYEKRNKIVDKKLLCSVLDKLYPDDPNRSLAFKMRYGLFNRKFKVMSQREVSDFLNMSVPAVCKFEKMTIKKLKENKEKITLGGYHNEIIIKNCHKGKSSWENSFDRWLCKNEISHIFQVKIPKTSKLLADFYLIKYHKYIEIDGLGRDKKYWHNKYIVNGLGRNIDFIVLKLYKLPDIFYRNDDLLFPYFSEILNEKLGTDFK